MTDREREGQSEREPESKLAMAMATVAGQLVASPLGGLVQGLRF